MIRIPFKFLRPVATRTPAHKRCRLALEALEARDCPSGAHLVVASYDTDSVLRYNEANGAFADTFVTKNPGHLSEPYAVLLGPHDHNLYVSSGQFHGVDAVMRYDGTTGAYLGQFADSTHLTSPRGIIFGQDGNLYVADGNGAADGRIVRYDGATGAFLNEFVPISGNGGLSHPQGLVFAPSVTNPRKLDLYVSSAYTNSVLRYDGTTGAFLGAFVPSGSGGLDHPGGLVFGPDGNLYVANFGQDGNRIIARFQGPSGRTPGAFLDTFVSVGGGGLETPTGLIFGPDGNGDGRQDLYVATAHFQGAWGAEARTSKVLRYDGVTGAFIDTFVAPNSGGLDDPNFLIFTETDPTTLAYRGGDKLTAASLPAQPLKQTLDATLPQPLITEALVRWQAARVDTSGLASIDIRIADLGGTTLGLASGNTIWLDDNAAGWGWFVDGTPWDDSEFTTPGNQGEQHRMDLLSAVMHEMGHLLRHEHDEDGVMAETLAAGTRPRTLATNAPLLAGDAFFTLFANDEEMPWLGKKRSQR